MTCSHPGSTTRRSGLRTRSWSAVARALGPIGPFDHGLDLCCGTGAGMEVLSGLCRGRVTGVDISAGMLAVGRERTGTGGLKRTEAEAPGVAPRRRNAPRPGARAGASPGSYEGMEQGMSPRLAWVRGDARALPFGPVFDLVVSFGAFGHFLPRELRGCAQVHSVLRPGSRFAFPVTAPPRASSPGTGPCGVSTRRCGCATRSGGHRSSCTTGRSGSATYNGS